MSVIVNSVNPFTNTKQEAEKINYKYNPDVAMYTGLGDKLKTEKFNEALEKEGFDYFMLKEIHEQPGVIGQTLSAFYNPAQGEIHLPDLPFCSSRDRPA